MIPVFIHLKSYIREENTSNLRVYEIMQAHLKKIFGPKRNKVVYRFLASVCTQVEMARGNSNVVGVNSMCRQRDCYQTSCYTKPRNQMSCCLSLHAV
jgi:hypothetical protein